MSEFDEMSYFYICLDDENKRKKIKLEFNNASIGTITVKELKNKLSSAHNNLPKSYDLTFFGKPLSLDQMLSNYGIKTGANLFVLPNYDEQESIESKKNSKLDQNELKRMMIVVRKAFINSNFRLMLNRLYEKEFRDNITVCTPGLKDNILAFTILLDPDLMMMLCTDIENLTKFSEKYLVFAEAAFQLVTAYHEEIMANSNQPNGISSGLSTFGRNAYSLNYESDDDLGGVDAAPPDGQQVRETQPIIQNQITVNQLQQAIQAASESAGSSDYLNRRQQLHIASERPFNSSAHSSFTLLPNQESTSDEAINQRQSERDWTRQLSTMRELGFTDDAISIQALEASSGNVQEAINWYFILNGQDI